MGALQEYGEKRMPAAKALRERATDPLNYGRNVKLWFSGKKRCSSFVCMDERNKTF